MSQNLSGSTTREVVAEVEIRNSETGETRIREIFDIKEAARTWGGMLVGDNEFVNDFWLYPANLWSYYDNYRGLHPKGEE